MAIVHLDFPESGAGHATGSCAAQVYHTHAALAHAAHMVVDSPARIPHRLRNEGSETFQVLVVKTPRPTESTQVL